MDYNVLFIRIITGLAIYYLGYFLGIRKAFKTMEEILERENGAKRT